LERTECLKRLDVIRNLYEICRDRMRKIQHKIESHHHDQLSERFILGKFDLLHSRLTKVTL